MKAKIELTGMQGKWGSARGTWLKGLGCFALVFSTWAQGEALRLQSAEVAALPGDQIRLDLELSGPAEKPAVFHTENPARIALDFPGVTNGLERKSIPIDTGLARNLNAVEAEGRTRVVLNLISLAPYEVETSGNHVFLTVRNQEGKSTGMAGLGESAAPAKLRVAADALAGQTIENIDFTRGDKGQGRVQITLGDPNTIADMREEAGNVIIYFLGATVPERLQKRLDVTDFASPVRTVEISQDGSRAKVIVSPATEDYDYLSYQTDNVMTIEFRPLTRAEKEEKKQREFVYTGDRLSLNFQDIPVRSVLQILSDFTGLNMVASDSVQGNVTLRLNDVPWDQALEVVLKSKGLAKRQEGNVVRIGPTEEIRKLEAEEVAALKVKEKLEPLRTELIAIKYADVANIQKLLTFQQTRQITGGSGSGSQQQNQTQEIEAEDQTQSLLSDRGSVSIDERTNTLIVKDTASNIEKIHKLVAELDRPVRQVLIESRIVIANDDYSRNLGVKFGTSKSFNQPPVFAGDDQPFIHVQDDGTRVFWNDQEDEWINVGGRKPGDLLVDLAAANAFGALGMTVLKVGDYLLDLELTALQAEKKGEILSNPRLLTSDYKEATIIQGFECPYTTAGSATQGNAVATVSFKKAVLELKVKPHVTPDDSVVMTLDIKKDDIAEGCGGTLDNTPAIQTRQIQTTVQVANGETVVLGGVYESNKADNVDKVPFFGDIPGVGRLFKRTENSDAKKELLIFITPKVVKNTLISSR